MLALLTSESRGADQKWSLFSSRDREFGMPSPHRGRPGADRPRRPDRKTLQMCSQVQRTLDLVLSGDLDDDRLRDLYVAQVTPAPDATRLLVTVSPLSFAKDFRPDVVMSRLAECSGHMRTELARAINRRKTPDLMFRVVMPDEVAPQLPAIDHDESESGEDE